MWKRRESLGDVTIVGARPASTPIPRMIHLPSDAFVVEGVFGRLAIFDVDRQDKETPKNRVVVDENVSVLGNTQPFSLKGRLRPFLAQQQGGIIERALAPTERAFVWFAPPGLDISTLLSTDKKGAITPAVGAQLHAVGEALAREIDFGALERLARDVFEVSEDEHASGFVRRIPEWEELHGPEARPEHARVLRRLDRFTYLEFHDLATALGATIVRLSARVQSLPENIEDAEHELDYAIREYGHDEFVVRPAYRAASPLVSDVALLVGVPALSDASENLPTLWFDGDTPSVSVALEALCVPRLRLADDAQSVIAMIDDPVTALWDQWPTRFGRILDGWHPSSRETLKAAVARSGVKNPHAICGVARDELLAFLGTSPHVIASTLYALRDDIKHALNWRRHAVDNRVNTAEYTKAVLMTVAAEVGSAPESAAAGRLEEVSRGLASLAQQVETIVNKRMAELRAQGCGDAAAEAIERPLRASIAAMRAATPARLAREHAEVELMLAALIGAEWRKTS